MLWLISLAVLSVAAISCRRHSPETATIPVYGYRIVAEYPHDRNASTQGLVYEDGWLYEGTGQYGSSSLRKVGLQSGHVALERKLPADVFGEGICIVGDRIIQLTWRESTGFIYDKTTFRKRGEFPYEGEGWGIAYDGRRLIMSDGTSTLRFLDPDTFVETGRIEVSADGQPLAMLNELEIVGSDLYANIWQEDRIVVIDPDTGQGKAWIDLTDLLPDSLQTSYVDVLNGIAYDPDRHRLFVTGKLWPKVFHIEIIQRDTRNSPSNKK
ncbi:MAG: glutaminyl-peptide cyclotransferase [Sedimentisphaerales bacterium]|nr:glutaminyl-peptide cyclotransferase [Sedimentisphaerales bacterium]